MELGNSAWNELCTTVGRTTTKMHFVPRFFICFQALNTQRVRLLARMLVPPQDFPFLASWGMVIQHIWRSKRCNVEYNTNSAGKIFCVKRSQPFTCKPFQSSWYFVLRTITLRQNCRPMPTSVSAEGILTPNHKNLKKRFSSFSR